MLTKKPALLLAACLPALFSVAQADARPSARASTLKLERVVMVMRHGIRPPTKANPVPVVYSSETWPTWPVGFGLLTPRGAAGAKLLGEADRALYATRGLLGAGCPKPGEVVLKASGKQRAIRTAESWSEGFMPGCAAVVAHPEENGPDPIFHGLDDEPASFDGQRALSEALALAPKGGIAAESLRYKPELALLAKVINCGSGCRLLTDADTLVATPHDRPELEGPLDIGSTASQTLLLEYLEGMPMKDVGWGRVTRPQIEQLLRFHPVKFRYSNRPDYVARYAAAPLAQEVATALTAPAGAKITLLAGHDTNIADLAGFFDVHWHVSQYPADDVPPGSALGFELLRDAGGTEYVRAFYRAQTMDQLRNQEKLTAGPGPFRQYLAIPGCGNSMAEKACTLPAFASLVSKRVLP